MSNFLSVVLKKYMEINDKEVSKEGRPETSKYAVSK